MKRLQYLLGLLVFGIIPLLSLSVSLVAVPTVAHAQDLTVTATVGVNSLNLRRAPRLSSSVKGKLVKGEQITLIGRASGDTWVEASTRFGIGWVDREYLVVGRTADLPIVSVMPPFLTSGVTDGLNIRMGPRDDYPIVTKLPLGQEADVIAYYDRPRWYLIATTRGVVGWVYGASAQLVGVLDNTPQTDASPMLMVTSYSVAVRPAPNFSTNPIGVARVGTFFTIIGRDGRGNWWQISGKFGTGWIAAGLAKTVGNLDNVPITDGSPQPLPILH